MPSPDDTVWQSAQLAHTYLTGVRGAIPFAHTQIDVMLRLVSAARSQVHRALDLGCGDGVLAEALGLSFPEAALVLLDFSEPMLEAARSRFRARRAAFVPADFGESTWTGAVSGLGPFDVVVSEYSIHHQPDSRKRELYAEIFDVLTPGGVFVNIEHVASATGWLSKLHDELFIDHLHSAQPSADRKEVASRYYYRPDRAANLLSAVEAQCEWLRRAGFVDVDCYLKVFELAVFGGRRQG